MQGLPLETVLREFAQVKEFRALGGQSYSMCRVLTKALLGKELEADSPEEFEQVLETYAREIARQHAEQRFT
jgi:hypothetical protein